MIAVKIIRNNKSQGHRSIRRRRAKEAVACEAVLKKNRLLTPLYGQRRRRRNCMPCLINFFGVIHLNIIGIVINPN